MKNTVVGGGNIGTHFAVHIAEKGHEVTMFTSNPGIFSDHLSIIDKEGNTIHEGALHLATNDPHKAFCDADMIIITMPPTMMIPLSELIYDNTGSNTVIGFVPGFGLEYVVSERTFYNSQTASELTKAISGEESLKGLTIPSVKAEAEAIKGRGLGGITTRRRQRSDRIVRHMERRSFWRERIEKRIAAWREKSNREKEQDSDALIPDLHSRYFTADFPYGLTVIQQIGKIAGVDIPNIDSLIDWYDDIAIINDKLIISDFGISDMESLRDFYLQ